LCGEPVIGRTDGGYAVRLAAQDELACVIITRFFLPRNGRRGLSRDFALVFLLLFVAKFLKKKYLFANKLERLDNESQI
jgi:hypothetical protein